MGSVDELRRDIERAMQDDLRMYAELRAQLERARTFVIEGDRVSGPAWAGPRHAEQRA